MQRAVDLSCPSVARILRRYTTRRWGFAMSISDFSTGMHAITPFTEAHVARATWWQRFSESYVGRALLSPMHAATFAGLVGACVVAQSPIPLLCGAPLAEALLVVALPRWSVFRRQVDKRREAQARSAREQLRVASLARMSDNHRATAIGLEALANALRARLQPTDIAFVDELVDTYVRLAMLHDEARRTLEDAFIDVIDLAIVGADAANEVSARRSEMRRANEQKLLSIEAELARIEEAVKLVHERTLLAVDLGTVRERVDALVDEMEARAPVVQALLSSE
jgi:hypothetical protein